jgi:hypothetical protein
MSDPLAVVVRMREMAVDEAKRALAECLTVEAGAIEALRLLDATIASETDAAGDPMGDDQMVEDFAAWLRRIGVERRAAVRALEVAEMRSTEARAALGACRAAAQAVSEIVQSREGERKAALERKTQLALEDAARAGYDAN